MSIISKLLLNTFETGLVPERIIRFYCKWLLSRGLDMASLGDIEAAHSVFRQVCRDIKSGIPLKKSNEIKAEGNEPTLDFYKLFLGDRLSETCGFFQTGAEDLNEAEDVMLWLSADRAKIRDGMKILEIGSGWGAMTFWLAEHFPNSKIVSIANSTKRLVSLKKKAIEKGISNIRFIALDKEEWNFEGQFDRIICIENYELLTGNSNGKQEKLIYDWLKEDGYFFLQQKCHARYSYYTDNVKLGNYPCKFIDSPALIPSAETFLMYQEFLSIADYWKISGEAYKNTAQRWLNRFYFNRIAVLAALAKIYGKKMAWTWMQRWKMFLIGLSEQFGYNRGQEWIISQYLYKKIN